MPDFYSDAYTKATIEQEQLAILKQAGRFLDQALAKGSPSAQAAVRNLKENAPKIQGIEVDGEIHYNVPRNLLTNETARNIILKWCDAETLAPVVWSDIKGFLDDD